MKKIYQSDRVIEYIKEFGSITRLEAFRDLGIANLTAVISSIRKMGIAVITEEVPSINRYGQKITYAKYIIKEEN